MNIKKKYFRNSKGQFVSNKDVISLRKFYDLNFPETIIDKEGKEIPNPSRPKSIRTQLKNLEPKELKEFIKQGEKGFIAVPERFLVDSFNDDKSEISIEMRIFQAKQENTKVYYEDEPVSYRQFLAIIKEDSNEIKNQKIKDGQNWYKSYAYVTFDREKNRLTYDPSLNDNDDISANPTNDKTRKELLEWQKNYKKGRKK